MTTYRLPSASNIARALVCPGSAVLPRYGEENDKASEGTAIHKFLQECIELGREEAIRRLPLHLKGVCANLYPFDAIGEPVQAEAAFSFAVEAGNCAFLGCGLDYKTLPKGPDIYCGIADVATRFKDEAIIADYKVTVDPSYAGRAKDSAQLKTLGLMAARAWGCTCAHVYHVFINPATGETKTDDHTLDSDALDAWEKTLLGLAETIAAEADKQPPRCVLSEKCKWCASLRYCPAQQGLVRAVCNTPSDYMAGETAIITPDNAARVWEKVEVAQKMLNDVKKSLCAYAAQTPIVLANGNVVKERETRRETIDGTLAREELTSLSMHMESVASGEDAQFFHELVGAGEDAFELSTSKAAIKRVYGKHANRVIQYLRNAGAITCKTYSRIAESKPRGEDDLSWND